MSRHHLLLDFHLTKKKRITLFDKFIMLAAIAYPLSTVPQVMRVFHGNAEGISLITWVGYMGFALLFVSYGVIHKIKPMIIGNTTWFIVDSLVVIGVMINR